ncbi:MAG: DUF808 domain-containing protein [Thiotrichales bacterium]
MAVANLLALIDDIATLLDDVSVLTKVAAKKTAGVLGDDLALNAEQVSGVRAERELPVVWAVFKGSLVNKLILVPAALIISAIAPWLITPALMLGGAFLCFEGFEKVAHKFLHSKEEQQTHHAAMVQAVADQSVDMVEFEKNKIKGAIRTDFILSAEIIVITLGAVATAALATRIWVVSIIALVMTMGVYGIVAGIVKLDDAGLHLASQEGSPAKQSLGRGLLRFAPYLMKTLSIVGTIAMFLVGGGILLHGIPGSHDILHAIEHAIEQLPVVGHLLAIITPMLVNGLFGLIAGGVIVAALTPILKLMGKAGH